MKDNRFSNIEELKSAEQEKPKKVRISFASVFLFISVLLFIAVSIMYFGILGAKAVGGIGAAFSAIVLIVLLMVFSVSFAIITIFGISFSASLIKKKGKNKTVGIVFTAVNSALFIATAIYWITLLCL